MGPVKGEIPGMQMFTDVCRDCGKESQPPELWGGTWTHPCVPEGPPGVKQGASMSVPSSSSGGTRKSAQRRSPLPSTSQGRILPLQLFPLFLNSTKSHLKVITKITLAKVASLGFVLWDLECCPCVTESIGAPLEMSPRVISSDGEQPQAPSARSRGPEQGSSQLRTLGLEGFSRFCEVPAGWVWELDGLLLWEWYQPHPWAGV